MPAPVNFPGGGPDQTLFMLLFAAGFVVGLLGHIFDSRTLRLVGILTVFVATAVLLADVMATSATAAWISSEGSRAGRPSSSAPFAGVPRRVE